MRIYLPALFLLLALELVGQVDYSVEYFPYIHKADLKIVTAEYKDALILYKKAFKHVDKGFSVDYTNAAVCATKTGKNKIAFQYLSKLVDKGIERTFFDTFPGFSTLRSLGKWNSFMGHYATRHRIAISDQKAELRNQITALELADQEFRIKEGSYQMYGDTIRKIDELNIINLIQFIQDNGFPNENNLGTSFPTSDIPGGIVFHHHCQGISVKSYHMERISNDFIEEFIGAIKRGEAEPHRVAFYISLQGDHAIKLGGLGLRTYTEYSDPLRLFYPKAEEQNLNDINNNRQKLGLESLEEFYLKSSFALRSDNFNNFIFDKYKLLNSYPDLNEEYFIEIK